MLLVKFVKTAALLLACAISLILGISFGPAGFIDLKDPLMQTVVLDYRLPRVLLAMLVGASLASAGCAMQAFFRNPLADPYILGVSSAASVGAALVISLGIGSTWNIVISAFITSLIVSFTVYRLGRHGESYAVLLAGIAVSSFLSGLTAIIIYFSQQSAHEIIFWIMGSFSRAVWQKIWLIIIPFFIGIIYLLLNSWNLNAILLGEEHARSVGINVERFRKELIAVTSLLTSATVAVCGIIGFVGIIVPHTMRLIFGEAHQKLLPSAILFGATLMPLVDLLARTCTSGEIPVGAMTAILGSPFFLYILKRGL
ncbi:MAG: iron ABC transporter permease [Archaeoglobi archaeon]|jgi:iron complex transport system permease protein|nr:MAG: iron ABC transporter permease [Archaeoglobi archaeon]TDA29187.1 MAG: iron ABC transporter permease [Archaeoglobi archaeon]